MVNYGYVLEPGQTAPSGKVEASIGTFAAAVLMLITSFVIFVMEILGFALAAYHFLSALFGSMGVLWAVAVSLARRHSFDLVGRAVGFIGAHLLMMVGILFVSLIGPALGTGLAQKIQGDSGNTGKALLSLVLMPVIYALVIYLMVKFSGRTGRVAQALRIGTNKKVRENYGYEGESWLKKVGLSDGTPEVPEPSTSGKLGTLARWGVPGTGYMEKLAKEHGMSLSGADNGEVAAAQDAAESSPLSSSYPDNGQAEQPHREAPEFTTEDGEPVSGYDVPYEVFDERGEPVTGWETDPDTGQPVPTTFAADGEPMPPVDADGHVNEVYDADGAPVYLFPTTAGSSAGMFLEPGDAAPDYVPTEPAVDNVYGDEAPVDDADAFDDGYDTEQPREVPVTTPAAVPGTPDFTATTEIPVVGDAVPDADDPETPAAVVPDAAVQETGEPAGHAVPEQDPDAAATAAAPTEQQWGTPTTYSVPDTTGTGVHGSCVTPVPPARITPALGGFPGEAEIPTRGEPLTAQEEAQAVDRIDRDLSGLPPEAGRQDALPGMEDLGPFHDPYDAYAADQPEVPGEHTFTSSSVRDAVGLDRVLAGIEEARDVQLASGGGSYVPVPVDSAQLELAFTTDELTGTNHVVPAHHVNLDGSLN
jgi:drug/metabolite transporter superfamily protein YnfA